MFVIRILLDVQPDHADQFETLIQQNAAEAKAQFAGCERFALFADVATSNRYLLYEEWESQAAFDTYRTSDYFKAIGGQLFPLMAGAPDSAYFNAERMPA